MPVTGRANRVRRPAARPTAGFTLIELMTAIAISGAILGAALGTFRMATHIYRRAEARREALESCRSALELIRRDLTGAFLSSDREVSLLFGDDLQSGDADLDTLRLTSLVNNPLRTGGATSDLAEVEYYIDNDPNTPERWLIRRYNPFPRSGLGRGKPALAGRHIVGMEIMYFSEGEWLTSWRSRSNLPRAVYVVLSALIDPEGETEEGNLLSLSDVVWLPHAHG